MKYSILTSFSIGMLAFMTTAEAGLVPSLAPGFPKSYNECVKIKGASNASCEALLTAPHKCEKYHSSDEEAWRNCLADAEATFHEAIAKGPSTEPYAGEILPVGTREADSDYYYRGPEFKGWQNAETN